MTTSTLANFFTTPDMRALTGGQPAFIAAMLAHRQRNPDHYEIRVCPGTRGYWCAIYEADSTSDKVLHETDSFGCRADAFEVAELWVDKRLDAEREADGE